jgi:beta-glucosidase
MPVIKIKYVFIIILIISLNSHNAVCQNSVQLPRYLDYQLSIEERVDDLVSRMTLKEKVSQMVQYAKSIPRLHIPEYNWWNECLHGVARAGIATVFPQAIGLAATWNTDLMYQIADVISTEARAKHHEFIRNDNSRGYQGLTFWSPNINIFRDPRWGRGQETYGEDPYLTARMGVAFVKGLQGDHPKYYKVIATPKHYAVHSGPEPERHSFDAVANETDLYDTYLPAFEAAVKEAGAYSVMCAYNRYQGEACCGSPLLLNEILREKWGFKGYVVSDCGAIYDIYAHHKIVKTAPEAAALAVKAGTDLNCGGVYDQALVEAVRLGLITEEEIDISVKRLFTARFKLGMFDPAELVPYAQLPFELNDSEAHHQLSIKAAQQSIVLLKNSNNFLPIKKDLNKIAVIGPTADSYTMLLGNYHGKPSKYVTALQGIKNKISHKTKVVFEQGCDLVKEGTIVHHLSSDMLSFENKPGLKIEYFKNNDFQGEPFFTRFDSLDQLNWVWGAFIPQLIEESSAAIRWSGALTVPETGEYNFIVKSDGGYRLIIGDDTVIEDWTDHDFNEKSSHLHLERGKSYPFKLEYFFSSGWPHLSIQWELLNIDHYKKALEVVKSSDLVIFVGGISAELEGEEMRVDYDGFKGGDRMDIKLPKIQENLLKVIYETGTPVVLVLTSGSALAVNWAQENIPAIIQLWYPGQEGGTALADVLFGDYNPAGRLPVTFYQSVKQLPSFEDYHMQDRTYRYFQGDPLYPFGYGLSFTRFSYNNPVIPDSTRLNTNIEISVDVQNTGTLDGDEVVQLYISNKNKRLPLPIRSLKGFRRIHLKAGEKKTVTFILEPQQFSVIDSENKRVVQAGEYLISLGGKQPGFSGYKDAATTEVITISIKLIK